MMNYMFNVITLLATPAVAVARAEEIAGRMAEASGEAVDLAIGLTASFDEAVVKKVREPEDETDYYQDALKAGKLHESAAYTERFARYRAKYLFPDESKE